MEKERIPFTWHYYAMGLGAVGLFLALTLLAWGSVVSSLAFIILSHPMIRFSGPTRTVFLLLFAVMYGFAFPDAGAVRALMAD